MSIKMSNSGITVSPDPKLIIGQYDRTRAEILNAAFRFLWSHPFRDMTVDKLTKQTSVSRTSFYTYFTDTFDLVKSMLATLESEILAGASPWLIDDGDPVALLHESLVAEVQTCYRCGPFLKAVTDAGGSDAHLETGWYGMLDRLDSAVFERIVKDQELGLIESFDPRPVATALNQVNASMYIRTFGSRPRGKPGPVTDAISRLWISTIYGSQWAINGTSSLYRKQT